MLVLSRSDIDRSLTMPLAIDAMRSAFSQLSSGQARVPVRGVLESRSGVTLTMPAYLAGTHALAVKVVSVFERIHGAVLLLDPDTGEAEALLDGASLTAWRTGAASGLATRLMAKPDARVLVIFGAGAQAPRQIEAVRAVRPIEEVRTIHRGDLFSLADADVIVTATNSPTPLFAYSSLPPRVHINAIGSFRHDMRELDDSTMRHSAVVVDQREAALAEAGEIIHSGCDIHAELGELLDKTKSLPPDRPITVFKSVGNAAQDAAIAQLTVQRARALGLGQEVSLG